jgi:hypothetical protein
MSSGKKFKQRSFLQKNRRTDTRFPNGAGFMLISQRACILSPETWLHYLDSIPTFRIGFIHDSYQQRLILNRFHISECWVASRARRMRWRLDKTTSDASEVTRVNKYRCVTIFRTPSRLTLDSPSISCVLMWVARWIIGNSGFRYFTVLQVTLWRRHYVTVYSVALQNDKWRMNGIGSGRKRSSPNLGTIPDFCWRDLENSRKPLSQDSWCLSRDSNSWRLYVVTATGVR